MYVGKFQFNDEVGLLTGSIRTSTLNIDYAELRPIPEELRGDSTAIVYDLYQENFAGHFAPIGTFWQKKLGDGTPYLSGFVDDTLAKEEKQFAMFGDEINGYHVKYRRGSPGGFNQSNGSGRGRPMQRRQGGFSGGSTANMNGEYVGQQRRELDDEVPF